MPTATFSETVRFKTMECCRCYVKFAITEDMRSSLIEDGTRFWCPRGHPQHYGKSESQTMREAAQAATKRAEEAEKRLKWAEADSAHYKSEHGRAVSDLAVTKRLLANTRRRIANGVCPCCHRTVSQLAAHMKTKHPDYDGPSGAGVLPPDTATPAVPKARRGRPKKAATAEE